MNLLRYDNNIPYTNTPIYIIFMFSVRTRKTSRHDCVHVGSSSHGSSGETFVHYYVYLLTQYLSVDILQRERSCDTCDVNIGVGLCKKRCIMSVCVCVCVCVYVRLSYDHVRVFFFQQLLLYTIILLLYTYLIFKI